VKDLYQFTLDILLLTRAKEEAQKIAIEVEVRDEEWEVGAGLRSQTATEASVTKDQWNNYIDEQ